VGGTLVSGTTQQCTINTKNIVLYTTQKLLHMLHTVVTERKKEVHYTLVATQQLQQYTTFTAVHNAYTETFS